MRNLLPTIIFLLALTASGCNLPSGGQPSAGSQPPLASQEPASEVLPVLLEPAGAENAYWVENPSSGAKLYTRVHYPPAWDGVSSLPALALIPGGIAPSDPQKATLLAARGFMVVIFDADGRGQSQGAEDYNGHITQDGLAQVIRAAAGLPGLDPGRYGLVSYSYGVTAASGALARHPDLPISFFIDWEGPVDRFYTTVGCGGNPHGNIPWQPCNDDAWWSEREAVTFITNVRVPYQRIQSEEDHVQPNNNHAIDIVNAAVAGDAPWVRLNEYPPNQVYSTDNPPAMIPEDQDRQLEKLVSESAWHIIEQVLPGLP
ncbi:MAG: hypothetical protein FJZ96_00800 [Chloroflexi bacterium]|nr:hypothetical protein [Chloroflexota bacterium]